MVAEKDKYYNTKTVVITESNAVSCSLNLSDENEEKVLSLTGEVFQPTYDREDDLIVYGGLATFNAVFGGDELMRIEAGAKFSFKTALPEKEATVVKIEYRVENVTLKKEGGMLYAAATVVAEITFGLVVENEFVTSLDALTKSGTALIPVERAFGGSYEFSDEFEEKKIKRVLQSQARVALKSVFARENAVVCEGECVISVLMLAFSDGEVLKTVRRVPFSFECDCEGASSDDCAYGDAAVDKLSLKVYVDEEKNRSDVSVEVTLKFVGAAINFKQTQIICDCYSPEIELVPSFAPIETIKYTGACATERVSGAATCAVPEYSRLLKCVGEGVEIADNRLIDGRLNVSGVLFGSALFADGENAITSRKFELPFSVAVVCDAQAVDNVKVTAEEVYLKLRAGRLEAETELVVTYREIEKSTYNAVIDVFEGEKKVGEASAISVYVGRCGDTEWDVTKRLGVPAEEIIKFNPELVFPLTGDEKIVVYRKIK